MSETLALAPDIISGDPAATVVVQVGKAFHEAGLPSNIVEQIMHDVADSLGVLLQVNSLPTSMTAAIGPPYAQKVIIMRLEPGAVDLRDLALLNDIVTELRSGKLGVDAALLALQNLHDGHDPAPALTWIAAYVMQSAGVAMVLGGGLREIGVSAVIGLATGIIAALAKRSRTVDRLFEVIAAFAATLIVSASHAIIGPFATYIAIVAGVVQLLPGVMLTTGLHELAHRSLVAGSARLAAVFVSLLSLTCGAALGIALTGEGAFGNTMLPPQSLPYWTLSIATVLIAAALFTHLHGRSRDFPYILASCAIAIAASHGLGASGSYQIAAFGSAFIVGTAASLAARYLHVPQASMLLPGLSVLVPGSIGYQGFLLIAQSKPDDGLSFALNSGIAAILIVAGLLLAQLVVHTNRFTRAI